MSGIKSSIGNRTFNSTSDTKHFTIPNDAVLQDEYVPEGPSGRELYNAQRNQAVAAETREFKSFEEAQAYRKQLIAERTGPNDYEKKRIELLVGIGRLKEDVPVVIDGVTTLFQIRTLKTAERKHVARFRDALTNTKSSESLLDIRTCTLAYCIYAIDNIDINYVLGCDNVAPEKQYEYRAQYINEMDDLLANYLFEKFEKLSASSYDALRINTPEEAKGVADALKKSGTGT